MATSDNTRPGFIRGELVDHPRHGPLPLLLLALTVVTGLVDAVSIISLGRVFVANMTGNVVFAGFAVAGAPGFSLTASVVALAAFLIGAAVGGVIQTRLADHRGVLLRDIAIGEAVLLVGAAAITTIGGGTTNALVANGAVAAAALALGLQNALVRGLAVPDLTTTVLTLTLTGIAADLRKKDVRVAGRRALSIIFMFCGAMIGATLDIHLSAATALAVAAAIAGLIGAVAAVTSRRPAPWHRPAQ